MNSLEEKRLVAVRKVILLKRRETNPRKCHDHQRDFQWRLTRCVEIDTFVAPNLAELDLLGSEQ